LGARPIQARLCRSSPLSSPAPFFFFHDPATTEIYTLSLHDALPIFAESSQPFLVLPARQPARPGESDGQRRWHAPGELAHRFLRDRKSTRLNSSHVKISYAVFCLKKKKEEL